MSISLASAARQLLIELQTRSAPQEARDQPGQRFADNQGEKLTVLMPADQRLERRSDPLQCIFDGLSLWWTDGPGILDPLAEQPGVAPLDLVDLKPLPEPLVKVPQLVDSLGPKPQGLADDLRGANHVLPRPAVERSVHALSPVLGQRLRQPVGLGRPALAQGNVENALNAVLLVIECRAGTDQ